MSDEVYCAKCHCPTEETLLLACDHNLCIQCAAENITRQECSGINKKQIVICDLCKSQTEIDAETSKEILQLSNEKSNHNINTNFQNPNNNIYNSLNVSNLSRLNNNNNINTINQTSFLNAATRDTCQEHGEPITYWCLDCWSKCICSECVVHGIHRNHEVWNIKKAYPLIYQKSEELLNQVDSKVKDWNVVDNSLNHKKSELSSVSEKCKREIKTAFEDIRIKLNKREKELLDKTDSMLEDNLQELNTYSRIIQSKIIGWNKINDSIQAHLMRKDELGLINFYCENKNKILSNTEITELDNAPDLQTISNLKVNIDKSSFDKLINSLNTLSFEINKMKGLDVVSNNPNNLVAINPQKYSTRRNWYGTNWGEMAYMSGSGSNFKNI